MPISKFIGARIKRREDPDLIRGRGQYVHDVNLPDMLHVAILRSPHAQARIKALEVEPARRSPGVAAIFTGAGLRDQIALVEIALRAGRGLIYRVAEMLSAGRVPNHEAGWRRPSAPR